MPPVTGRRFSIPPPDVCPEDLANLRESGLTDDTIRANGLRTEGEHPHGWLVFPYRDSAGTVNCFARRRLHTPRGDQKYDQDKGTGKRAYFPAGSVGRLRAGADDVYVTEGEKKALALDQIGLAAVGLGGVWNGTEEDGAGWRLIADLRGLPWAGRRVFVCFDYDAKERTRRDVGAARRRLAKAFYAAGAREVLAVELPPGPGETKQGVDDYIARHGEGAFVSLAARSARQDTDPKGGRGGEPCQSEALLRLAGVGEYWHTPDDVACVTLPRDGHKEHWPVRSRAFRNWLGREFYKETGKAPGAQTLADVVNALEGRARFEGATHPFPVRVAGADGRLYLDLCDDGWRAVEIDADGWRVVGDPPVRFRRSKSMLPLPEPAAGGTVAELRRFANVADDSWPLLLAFLAAAYRAAGPYALLKLVAEQGSGKSTLARVVRALVDPNTAPLRSAPRGERDLMIAATNGWLVCLDNLSFVDTELSDALCRLATGGGFATRTLYTDDEEAIFTAQRPVVLNGIEDVGYRSDLLDRTLVVEMPRIDPGQRKPESEFWAEFEAARPRILGALLDAAGAAVRNLPAVTAPAGGWPRMADFAMWAVAAEPALGLEPGEFLRSYAANRETAGRAVLESSPVVAALVRVLHRTEGGEGEWTAKKLLAELAIGQQDTRRRDWPKNERALAGQLNRLAPSLRAAGWVVEQVRAGNEKRWRIGKQPPAQAPEPEPPPPPTGRPQRPQSSQKSGPGLNGAAAGLGDRLAGVRLPDSDL